MKISATVFIIVLFSYSNLMIDRTKADISVLCGGSYCQGPDCDITEGPCKYGIVKNFCGQLECAKGPNEKCGGEFDMRGKCGNGLVCSCDECIGCSTLTYECSEQKICQRENFYHHNRLSKRFNMLKKVMPFPYAQA